MTKDQITKEVTRDKEGNINILYVSERLTKLENSRKKFALCSGTSGLVAFITAPIVPIISLVFLGTAIGTLGHCCEINRQYQLHKSELEKTGKIKTRTILKRKNTI